DHRVDHQPQLVDEGRARPASARAVGCRERRCPARAVPSASLPPRPRRLGGPSCCSTRGSPAPRNRFAVTCVSLLTTSGAPMSTKILLGAGAAAVVALVAGTAWAGGGLMAMGPAGHVQRAAFHGYYDGHKVTYLNTDVSNKAEAKMMHIN